MTLSRKRHRTTSQAAARRRGRRRAAWVALLTSTALVAVLAGPASATFPGSPNGRIFFQGVDRNTRSFCPGETASSIHAGDAYTPDVSGDGSTLAYWYIPSSGSQSARAIYVQDLASGGETKITGSGGIVSDAESWDPATGGNTPTDPVGRWLSVPRFSPDGSKLAVFAHWVQQTGDTVTSGTRVGLIDLGTGHYTPLGTRDASIANQSGQDIAWTPDGSKIFFVASHREGAPGPEGDEYRLFRVNATGGEATIVDAEHAYGHVDVSPDGTKLLASRYRQAGPFYTADETYEMNLDGSSAELVVSDGYGGEAYSPDGTKIVGGGPNGNVWTMNRDGTEKVDTGTGQGSWAVWSATVLHCDIGGHQGMRVNEVMVERGGDPTAQFVELLDAHDESFPTGEGPYGIAVFNAANTRIAQHNFPATFLSSKDTAQPILISNPSADAGLGVAADHHTDLPLSLPTDAGRVCFSSHNGAELVSCVAYGCFGVEGLADTDYAPLAPPGQSIQRQSVTSTLWLIADPTPKAANVEGSSAASCIPPPSGDRPPPPGPDPAPRGDSGAPRPAPPGEPADTTGPTVAIPARNKTLTVTTAGVVPFRLGPVAENVTGVISLKSDGKVKSGTRKRVLRLASDKSFQALTGQRVVVRIKLSKAARKLLKRSKRIKVQANITLRDAKGNATVKAYRFAVKAAKKKS